MTDASPLEAAPTAQGVKLTPFVLSKETQGRVVGVCQIVLAGGDAVRLEAYGPSTAAAAEEIDTLFRPEDQFGNVASSEPGPVVVRVFRDSDLSSSATPGDTEIPKHRSACRKTARQRDDTTVAGTELVVSTTNAGLMNNAG